MKAFARCFVAFVFAAIPLSGMAQQNFTDVSVYRVVKLRILPGKTKEFFQSFAYAPKIFDAEKTAGLVLDYQIFRSVTYEGPDKYDIMYVVHFKNMASLDTFSAQSEDVVAKVYGSPEKRAEISKLRAESSETVSSELVRDIQLKPQP